MDFEIRGDLIDLGQLAQGERPRVLGGEAKAFLATALVRVNGEPEARRGRTLRAGDAVELAPAGRAVVVIHVVAS